MKFSLSWLKTHLDTDAAVAMIADTLTRIGLELEGIDDRGAALAGFRIARVIEAAPHPNAERLRVCTVDTGNGVAYVVCGAPNARTGMKSVFAAPGSVIPGTGATLQADRIRGVVSAGMLLSLRELGLGEDHAGIIDLPEDAPLGVPYAAWAGLDDQARAETPAITLPAGASHLVIGRPVTAADDPRAAALAIVGEMAAV